MFCIAVVILEFPVHDVAVGRVLVVNCNVDDENVELIYPRVGVFWRHGNFFTN